MPYQLWITLAGLALAIILLDRRYYMLRDTSAAKHPPYSWSRVQLAWWTLLILSAFITIFWVKKEVPALDTSILILLGISAATTAVARAIDVSDQANPLVTRHQDLGGANFFMDILSDQNGPSIHRFQAIVFNFVFGLWIITSVAANLQACGSDACINSIIPVMSDNNLLLLGLSSGTYAALKTMENRSTPANPGTGTPTGQAPLAGTDDPVS